MRKSALCQIAMKLALWFEKEAVNVKMLRADGQTKGLTDRRQTKSDQKRVSLLKENHKHKAVDPLNGESGRFARLTNNMQD